MGKKVTMEDSTRHLHHHQSQDSHTIMRPPHSCGAVLRVHRIVLAAKATEHEAPPLHKQPGPLSTKPNHPTPLAMWCTVHDHHHHPPPPPYPQHPSTIRIHQHSHFNHFTHIRRRRRRRLRHSRSLSARGHYQHRLGLLDFVHVSNHSEASGRQAARQQILPEKIVHCDSRLSLLELPHSTLSKWGRYREILGFAIRCGLVDDSRALVWLAG